VNPVKRTRKLQLAAQRGLLHAFVHAIGVEQPLVCGFSDGGIITALLGIRHPGSARALVNFAGFDLITPEAAQAFPASRTTQPDIEHYVRMFTEVGGPDWLGLFQQDYDGAQGPGSWRTYLTQALNNLDLLIRV
jgi:pimeloyl-ACP methyl ester carboxylesterase